MAPLVFGCCGALRASIRPSSVGEGNATAASDVRAFCGWGASTAKSPINIRGIAYGHGPNDMDDRQHIARASESSRPLRHRRVIVVSRRQSAGAQRASERFVCGPPVEYALRCGVARLLYFCAL